MKRWGSVVSVLSVLGVGAGTAAAQATATASIHLKAPTSISASKLFRVTASGTAPSSGKQFVFIAFTNKSSCAKSIAAADSRGDVFLPWGPKHHAGKQVPHGSYSVTTDRVKGGNPGHGLLCGYLYKGSQSTSSAPEAHTSRAITFTGTASPRKAGAAKVLN
jgi:hypothetical protein